jgi:hypothetical protein
MTTQESQIIIVGGGISGLYSAYQIKKISPNTSFLILEGFQKKWFGGRIGTDKFYGVDVVRGAGVGRKKKDKLLLTLCKELGVETKDFISKKEYAKTIHPACRVENVFLFLKKEFQKDQEKNSKKTFREFAFPLLGKEGYSHFTTCSAYTDYENESAYDTLYHYNFDDNYKSWTGVKINWNQLMNSLLKAIGPKNLQFSKMVEKITLHPNEYEKFGLTCKDGSNYTCNQLIFATTIESVQKLIPEIAPQTTKIYSQIHGQTFLRVYGKFSKSSLPILDKYIGKNELVVPGPLQKIIPLDIEKGVYMIAYSDNKSADFLKPYLKNTEENRDFFCDVIEKSVGIPEDSIRLLAIKDYYWPIGTHYYEPLRGPFQNRKEFIRVAQRPLPDLLVVGEMVSENQGWTEGALESVSVLTKKWIK